MNIESNASFNSYLAKHILNGLAFDTTELWTGRLSNLHMALQHDFEKPSIITVNVFVYYTVICVKTWEVLRIFKYCIYLLLHIVMFLGLLFLF